MHVDAQLVIFVLLAVAIARVASARRAPLIEPFTSARAAANVGGDRVMIATDAGGVATASVSDLVDALVAAAERRAKAHADAKVRELRSEVKGLNDKAIAHANAKHDEAVALARALAGRKFGSEDVVYLEWQGSDARDRKNGDRHWVGLKNGNDNPLELQAKRDRAYFRLERRA